MDKSALNSLLMPLDPNPETATGPYETIRGKLMRYFLDRGCNEAEDLADKTITRVIDRLVQQQISTTDPVKLIYGVARNVYADHLRATSDVSQAVPDNADESANRSWEEGLVQANANREMLEALVNDDWLGMKMIALLRQQPKSRTELFTQMDADETKLTALIDRFIGLGLIKEDDSKLSNERGAGILEQLEKTTAVQFL